MVRLKRKAYHAWYDARRRCTNSQEPAWRFYGAKGVTMCPRWEASFEAFLADVGLPPSRDFTIDRIDPCGNYEPGNVRWLEAWMSPYKEFKRKPESRLEPEPEKEKIFLMGRWYTKETARQVFLKLGMKTISF